MGQEVEGASHWWWFVQQWLSQKPKLWGLAKERLVVNQSLFVFPEELQEEEKSNV